MIQYSEVEKNFFIAYEEAGKGNKTLLFIHGLGENHRTWIKNFSQFSKSNRCIAIDLPGHGLSSDGNFNFSVTFYAEMIEKFIQKMELKNFTIIAHSLGAQISVILSLRLSALLEKLILIAPAGIEKFSEHDKLSLRQFASIDWHSFVSEKKPSHACTVSSINGMLNEPVYSFYPLLTVPVLLIFGKLDTLIPNKYLHNQTTEELAKEGQALLKNGKLLLVNFAGHFVQIEKPEKVNSAIEEFLK